MSVKPIAIYGAGGLGKEVLALIKALPEWNPIGFYDDQITNGTSIKGIKVLGDSNQLEIDSANEMNLIIAIGDPTIKKKLVNKLNGFKGILYPTLVHPTATLMDLHSIEIGDGSIVSAGCILTTDVSIGKHVLVNINSTIGHDCEIGDCTSIMPDVNLAGGVKVGQEVLIGSGVNVMNAIHLGDRCKIGMGSVVLQDINVGSTAVGVPAKMIKNI